MTSRFFLNVDFKFDGWLGPPSSSAAHRVLSVFKFCVVRLPLGPGPGVQVMWQQKYPARPVVINVGVLGFALGLILGLGRAVAFHNRMCCYRVVASSRRRKHASGGTFKFQVDSGAHDAPPQAAMAVAVLAPVSRVRVTVCAWTEFRSVKV